MNSELALVKRKWRLPACRAGLLLAALSWPALPLLAAPYMAYDPRAAAMGGATVALPSRYAPMQNIALAGRGEELVDWHFATPLLGRHDAELNDFRNHLQAYQRDLDRNRLLAMDGDRSTQHSFAALTVTVPSDIFGGGVYLLREQYSGLRTVIDTGDLQGNSVVEKRGIRITENGFGVAQYQKSLLGLVDNVVVGFMPKLITAHTVLAREPVASASTSVGFNDSTGHGAFNVDAGLLRELSRFTAFGMVARNVLPMKFAYSRGSDEQAVFNPQVRAGVAYERRDRAVALDIDLTSNPDIAFTGRSRFVAVGGELTFGELVSVRAGVRLNMLGDQEVVFTGGGGIGVNGQRLDLAVERSDIGSGLIAHLNLEF